MRPEGSAPAWRVICLCAAWCRVCEAYQPGFAARRSAPGLSFHWLDVEDEADHLGDLDIETFPSLLVLQGDRPRFFGPVLPQPDALDRLLHALRADPAGPTAAVPAGLPAAVQARLAASDGLTSPR
ncbi:cytochrome P450 family protein [Aquariibacter albus]|uniref:Thioredoxin n=1 Tax=Aquariibacter albus TaxID=2759899 RepID=A0A839HW19_9BURK|nr:thioredoxin [Aquariibacter albus]MBB1162874.1 thioredoxin [Aquariibacter albus]